MEDLEFSAKTLGEAIDRAHKHLEEAGIDPDTAEVVVVDKGRQGILGLGSGLARVRIETGAPDTVDLAKETIEGLLRAMGVSASVGLPQRSTGPGQKGDDGPSFNIDGEDAGLLIGRRGETLASLQFVLNFMLSRKSQDRVNVRIDVEGYRDRREDTLRTLANRMAERAVSTGHTVTLEPMPARERRVIHVALSNSNKVTTESVGERDDRKVTIIPKKGARPSSGARPGGTGGRTRRTLQDYQA